MKEIWIYDQRWNVLALCATTWQKKEEEYLTEKKVDCQLDDNLIYSNCFLSPIYTAENFWHGSDVKSTRTKKIGSARIDLVL